MRASLSAMPPAAIFVLFIVAALTGAIFIVVITLSPSNSDLLLLLLFMSGTGIVTVSLSYHLYRRGFARWMRSLRWALLITVVFTVILMFINVWVTAKLMFISYHDLALTTALLLFAGLTSIAFGFFVSTTITDGIRELAQAARQLAQGDLSVRLDVRGNDELARLAETFNWMASNLQLIDEEKRAIEHTRSNLIAWVSHDLRTPLSSMRVMIEALMDGVVSDPETVQRYLQNTQAEIKHLSTLINDLFELAQIDVGHFSVTCVDASLGDLISDTIGSMSAQAQQKQITLRGHMDEGIDPVYMAPDKIQRVLYNLVDNAIQHTPASGTITLNAYSAGSAIRIDVHNTGSSIDARDIPHIFSSFYRGEPSRSRSENGQRGAGLGLAITRGIVEAHGGKIWLENPEHQDGTTLSFIIPRTAQIVSPSHPLM